jgi:hypothetical protein
MDKIGLPTGSEVHTSSFGLNASLQGQKQPLEMPKEVCKYGEKCFRTGNPHHLQEYSHPHLEQNNKMNSS